MVTKKALKTYQIKRDFNKTPESVGKKKRAVTKQPVFVIQKHKARTLHYDFRIEVEGVLLSWVLPKGPSTDPRKKRLAIPVEEHPLDYADFEGVIPEGEYGSGTVMVWDTGRYTNLKVKDGKELAMRQCLSDGHVEINLSGKKIRGGYSLIRTSYTSGGKKRWMLTKIKDEQADARRKPTSTENRSVLTDRTMKQIRDNAKEVPETRRR